MQHIIAEIHPIQNLQKGQRVKAILFDTEGPWLAGGWDMPARMQLAELFGLDYNRLEEGHMKNYKSYQTGAISFGQYSQSLLSGQQHEFSSKDFDRQLRLKLLSDKETINYLKRLKNQYKIKILAVNDWFGCQDQFRCPPPHLEGFIDAFVLSGDTGGCLSDAGVFAEAVKSANLKPDEILCFDDRQFFVQAAIDLGMKGVLHTDISATKLKFRQHGLVVNI